MKQILLALVLILVPVAAFTGFEVLTKAASTTPVGLGDLSAFKTIVADVQSLAAKGDMAAAARRITDYESAWDQAETALRPLNSAYWGTVDEASDVALEAVRSPNPPADKVQKALAALMAALNNPAKPAD